MAQAGINKVVLAYSGGTRHVRHPAVAPRDVRRRRRRRSRPTSAKAKRSSRRQARRPWPPASVADLHRRPAARVRRGLRLPGAPRRRQVRDRLPARHELRAAADRQAHDRGGRARGGRRRRARRDRQGQRPGALRAHRLRAQARRQGDRALARVGPARGARTASPTPTNTASISRRHAREAPYSMDANMFHISYEGGVLEDPWNEPPPEDMWRLTTVARGARRTPRRWSSSTFEHGDPVAIDGRAMSTRWRCMSRAQHDRRRARRRARRPGREPLRRHEVARLLRDAGRDACMLRGRTSALESAHARPRGAAH
jgi:hypothetical protein